MGSSQEKRIREMKEKALRFDMYSAYESGAKKHPQEEMRRLGLDNYYRAEPRSIGDCWLFFFKEWPAIDLPTYLNKIEIDYGPKGVPVDYSGCIFLPGDTIKHKDTGRLAIVEYDYATAFWGNDHKSLSLCELDKDGNIYRCWAWADADAYEIVDSESRERNLSKMREYHKGHEVPYYIKKEIAEMIYGWEDEK